MQQRMLDGSALERARQKKRRRRLRNAVILCLALTALFLNLTGLGGIYADRIGNIFETVRLRLYPGSGLPVATEAEFSAQLASLQDALVLADDREVTVYSTSGLLLRNLQHSYAKPCLSAGTNHFCIYNQGGKELRIEGRSRSYGTVTTHGNIWFAQMSKRDTLAVATQDESYQAMVTVYADNLDEMFSWCCASEYPVTAAFSPDSKQIAVCCISSSGGVCTDTVYVIDAKGEQAKTERNGNLILSIAWVATDRLLVAYEDAVVLYRPSTLEQVAYYPVEQPLLCCDLQARDGPVIVNGNVGSDSDIILTMLDKELSVQRRVEVDAAALPRDGSKMRWQCLQQSDTVWLLGNPQILGFSRDGGDDCVWSVSNQPIEMAAGQRLYLLTAGELTEYTQNGS